METNFIGIRLKGTPVAIDRIPMTREGLEKLKEELDRLKREVRPKVVMEIQDARAHGDIAENAEFHAAKEKQSFVEGRIQELTGKISRAEVIDISKLTGNTVVFGAKVQIEEVETGEMFTYRIVGEDEADVDSGMISVASPMARALIGKELDEQVMVKTPRGTKEFIIMDVSFD